MFEKAKPIPQVHNASGESADQHVTSSLVSGDASMRPDGEWEEMSLREVQWDELKARLSAARDLREVLRQKALRSNAKGPKEFAKAADNYFRTNDDKKRDVNPVALEQRKCSPGIVLKSEEFQSEAMRDSEYAAQGDARED